MEQSGDNQHSKCANYFYDQASDEIRAHQTFHIAKEREDVQDFQELNISKKLANDSWNTQSECHWDTADDLHE